MRWESQSRTRPKAQPGIAYRRGRLAATMLVAHADVGHPQVFVPALAGNPYRYHGNRGEGDRQNYGAAEQCALESSPNPE